LDGHCQRQPVLGDDLPGLPDESEKHERPHSSPPGLADRAALSTARPPCLGERDQQREYREKFYTVPESESPLEVELAKYLPKDEMETLAAAKNKATQLISAQSRTIKDLFASQELAVLHHTEMQKTLKDLLDQQSKSERIKNFPYPRQYATINTIFVWCFATLLPFCIIREFDRLNDGVSGLLAGQMAWLTLPFSALVSWMYVSLDQVGESTENPFEGGANDVPISQISRLVEIELRQMLGETDLPPLLRPKNDIIL
jgi:ion channel-forming bestrophin family protein